MALGKNTSFIKGTGTLYFVMLYMFNCCLIEFVC